MWNAAAESKSTVNNSNDSSTGGANTSASANAKGSSSVQDTVFDLVAETFPAKGSSAELKER